MVLAFKLQVIDEVEKGTAPIRKHAQVPDTGLLHGLGLVAQAW